MPDTYGSKPTADQLLHDLTRIFVVNGATIQAPGSVPLSCLEGPMDRVYGAIEEFHRTDFNESTSPYANDEYDMLTQQVEDADMNLMSRLAELCPDATPTEIEDIRARIILWGERLAAVRVRDPQETRQKRLDDAIEALS
jgi:hypothetical protein